MLIRPLDLAIIVAYLAGITAFGAAFRKQQRGLRDYFLGGRTAPWWALACSIVATETSTLTIIGTPAIAYAGSLVFLQLAIGYLVARVIVCIVFIPQYFQGDYFTAYQLLEKRFGARMKRAAAVVFLGTRALAEGVRLSAISKVVSVAFGTGDRVSVAIVAALTIFYTFEGGMRAVIWTDVAQFFLYIAGSVAAFFLLLHKIPGGWGAVTHAALLGNATSLGNALGNATSLGNAAAGVAGGAGLPAVAGLTAKAGAVSILTSTTSKLRVFDFSFSLTRNYTFWSGVIGGTFLTMASHGTDQTMVQRLLAARNERDSKKALLASGVIIFMQFALFLLIGVMLWVFAQHVKLSALAGNDADRIFPAFIVHYMPAGLTGALLASMLAVAMSNASGSLNSLASSTVIDLGATKNDDSGDQRGLLSKSRRITLVWGVILGLLGLIRWGPVLEAGLTIASITYGGLLGVFLLGTYSRRATESGALAGFAAGILAMIAVHLFTPLAFTWYVLLGSAITFAVGYFATVMF